MVSEDVYLQPLVNLIWFFFLPSLTNALLAKPLLPLLCVYMCENECVHVCVHPLGSWRMAGTVVIYCELMYDLLVIYTHKHTHTHRTINKTEALFTTGTKACPE